VPTEKKVADYQEQRLAEQRKQWDEDFNYSEPGTGTDRELAKNKKS
jgi:hypothetical protein